MKAVVEFSLAFVSMLLSTSAIAETACPDKFYGGQPPAVLNKNLTPKTRELCYTIFSVLHSGLTRTPLYSAEHLTREGVSEARGMERENTFHPDPSLPANERSELSDFRGSGFDRGHLSPSADANTPEAQYETFSLGNMIPQDPNSNRNLWSMVEITARSMAISDGEVFVVTGPIFWGNTLQSLKGRVLIPTYVYKAILDPSKGYYGAYITRNAPGGDYEVLTLAQLQQLSGIDAFPALPASYKTASTPLPPPRGNGFQHVNENTGSLGVELQGILGQ